MNTTTGTHCNCIGNILNTIENVKKNQNSIKNFNSKLAYRNFFFELYWTLEFKIKIRKLNSTLEFKIKV